VVKAASVFSAFPRALNGSLGGGVGGLVGSHDCSEWDAVGECVGVNKCVQTHSRPRSAKIEEKRVNKRAVLAAVVAAPLAKHPPSPVAPLPAALAALSGP
jgi:hypothetical protein